MTRRKLLYAARSCALVFDVVGIVLATVLAQRLRGTIDLFGNDDVVGGMLDTVRISQDHSGTNPVMTLPQHPGSDRQFFPYHRLCRVGPMLDDRRYLADRQPAKTVNREVWPASDGRDRLRCI